MKDASVHIEDVGNDHVQSRIIASIIAGECGSVPIVFQARAGTDCERLLRSVGSSSYRRHATLMIDQKRRIERE